MGGEGGEGPRQGSLNLPQVDVVPKKKAAKNGPHPKSPKHLKDTSRPAELFDLIPTPAEAVPSPNPELPSAFRLVDDHSKYRKLFEHFLKVDAKRTEDEELRKRMRESRTKMDVRAQNTAEKLLPLLGDLQHVDARTYPTEAGLLRNKWTDTDYAFDSVENFKVENSALTGHEVMRYGKRVNMRGALVVSDSAFEGVHPSLEKHDPSKRAEDLHAVDSLLYGKDFGKYLHGGTFEHTVIGGAGALSNAENLRLIDTTLVLPHGTYYFDDVIIEGTFRIDEKYRVA